jgi:ubiquinone/menaquinone biosynthesis C-methylase UbiE
MNTAAVKQQFNARASKFARSAGWVTDRKLLAAHRKAIAGFLPAKGSMLEVCCGTGAVSGFLKRAGIITYGLDIAPGMLAKAAKHIRHLSMGDAHALPFAEGSFDVVVMRQAMQFLAPGKFLKEAKRVLKPGGVLLLSHHVPRSKAEHAHLLRIYRLLQPSGVFRNPSKLYLAGELRAHLKRSGLRLKRELSHFSTESVAALLGCYPNLSAGQKDEILNEYLKIRSSCKKNRGIVLNNGKLRAVWKWAVFTAQKPNNQRPQPSIK